ncbi:MAG: family metallopeptidase [Marmoricola sp.]|nr:family metallopeptidase [Marmoricola sp.]
MWRWLPALLLVAACGGASGSAAEPDPTPTPSATPSATPSPAPSATPKPTPSATPKPTPVERADPRWRFYTADRTSHSSPWFAGRHRVMIGFGCTPAPYYDHDPRCPDRQGFHHGIDVAMPCGTLLTSAVDGVVLDPSSSGSPGAAYGERPFGIRTGEVDVLIGHARQVFVHPGDRVREGQRIALSSDSGAPDGCHLHFEVRRPGTGLSGAVDPAGLLQLS